MKLKGACIVLTITAISAISVVSATTDDPSNQTIEELARDFNTTPEQLEKWIKRELGEPLFYEDQVGVIVRRSDGGEIDQITIATPRTLATIVPNPGETKQAMSYGSITSVDKGHYIDIDGDGSIDWMFFANDKAHSETLIRLGHRFVTITSGSVSKGVEIDGKIYTFDRTSGDWIEGESNDSRK